MKWNKEKGSRQGVPRRLNTTLWNLRYYRPLCIIGPLSQLDLIQEKEENGGAKWFENKPLEKQLNSVGQRLPGMCEAVSLIPQHY